MTNKKENSNNEQDLPGYPHYPAKDDIMNSQAAERVDIDVENLSPSHSISSSDIPNRLNDENNITSEDKGDIFEENSDADITADDLIALEGTDEDLAKVDALEGEDDLDVPGAEQDDADEAIGEEDEENNYYSLGGDAHENLDEDNG